MKASAGRRAPKKRDRPRLAAGCERRNSIRRPNPQGGGTTSYPDASWSAWGPDLRAGGPDDRASRAETLTRSPWYLQLKTWAGKLEVEAECLNSLAGTVSVDRKAPSIPRRGWSRGHRPRPWQTRAKSGSSTAQPALHLIFRPCASPVSIPGVGRARVGRTLLLFCMGASALLVWEPLTQRSRLFTDNGLSHLGSETASTGATCHIGGFAPAEATPGGFTSWAVSNFVGGAAVDPEHPQTSSFKFLRVFLTLVTTR